MLEFAILEQAARASIVETRAAPAEVTQTPSWARPVTATCIVEEAARQSMDVLKVLAVLAAENGRVGQFVRNTNGSYDIGPMQINTIHLPELARTFGVSAPTMAQLLAYDGCFNVAVGAYVLRKRTNEASGDFWYGIGRYHSKTEVHSTRYIYRVRDMMLQIVKADELATRKQASERLGSSVAANVVAQKGE